MRAVIILSLLLLTPGLRALELEGNRYDETISVAGKTLHLIGVGMREATFLKIDVYTFGAHAVTRTCDLARMRDADEVKHLQMDFIRDVSADKMHANMKDNFATQTPKDASASLKARVRTFLGTFDKDIIEGTSVQVDYIPSEGTRVKIGGRQVGAPIPGADFMRVVWAIWFGRETCCPGLVEGVQESCRR
jgi:hypothetical protein